MISIFPNITNTTKSVVATPHVIVESIKNGGRNNTTKDLVTVIRKTQDKSKRNSIKGQLPCIMWSGIFKKRAKSGLIKHSGLICLDFDDVPDIEQTKIELCKDEYVYCCFVSPSGNGLKVVVRIPQEPKSHQDYFRALAGHFSWIDIDGAAKDVSRVCYASHDPEAYFNPTSKKWDQKGPLPKKAKRKPQPVATGESLPDNEALDIVKKAIDKQIEFISGQKHDHLLKFAGYANRAGVPEQQAIDFYNANYDKKDVEKIMSNVYRNYTEEYNTSPIVIQAEPKKSEYLTFWAVSTNKTTKETKPIFSRQKFINWLKDEGFARYHYTDASWMLVKHESNIVQKIARPALKQFVFTYIQRLPFEFDTIYRSQLYELIARGVSSFFSDDLLELLPPMEIETHRDDRYSSYLYFYNCVVKSTDKGIELIDYNKLDGYVWKEQIIDRDFIIKDEFANDYQELLGVVCGGEDDKQTEEVFKQRMKSIESVVGFLLHSHKDPRYCPAIIINDQYINDDNPEGGTGKGIFLNGISHLKRVKKIDGKTHKMDSNFAFQVIDVDTQIVIFEDVLKGWNFEVLFSIITEGITVEKKGKDAFYIDFKQSPKTVITTNYTIKGEGNSHERRRLELEFHGYFRDTPPFEYFGKRLFDDWDEDHWQRFDNYMVACLHKYLKNGVSKPPVVNLNERKLRERTHPEFIEFVSSWIEEGRFTSKELHDKLKKQNPDFEKYNQSTITRWIKFYMNHLGIEFDKARIATDFGFFRGFEVTSIPKGAVKKVVNDVVESENLPVNQKDENNQKDDMPF